MSGPPPRARLAAARAGLPDPERAAAVGFSDGDPASREPAPAGDGTFSGLGRAWSERRHLVVRCGPLLGLEEAVGRLVAAGVSSETPALLASDLGTGRERLLYGSLGDVGLPGFAEEAVLVVPHPAALPVDFAWPPTAAP